MANVDNALKYAACGIRIFQCGHDKRPLVKKDWLSTASTDAQIIRAWWQKHPDALIGLPLKPLDLIVIDADRHDDNDGVEHLRQLAAKHGALPPHPWCTTAGNGEHHYFRQPANGGKIGNRKIVPGIETRGCNGENDGGYVVASGSELPDGRRWWRGDGSPSLIESYRDGKIPELPTWLLALMRPPEPPPAAKPKPPNGHARTAGTATNRHERYAQTVLDRLCTELAAMPRESGRNNALNVAGCTMGHAIASGWIGRAEVEQALFNASMANGLVKDTSAHAARATIKSGIEKGLQEPHRELEDRPLPPKGEKKQQARQEAPRKESKQERTEETATGTAPPTAPPPPSAQPGSNNAPDDQPLSEDALALRFAARHASALRFVALKGQWLKWDDCRWLQESTLLAFDLARHSIRRDLEDYTSGKAPVAIASAKTVTAVERLAKADRRLAAELDQWDANPAIINMGEEQ
jgi:putative DNA primase/helicase